VLKENNMAGRPRTELRTQVYDIWCNLNYINKHQQPGKNGCVEWTAGKHRQGYGMTGAWRADGSKIMTTVHRVLGRLKYGRALAESEYIVHTCSNMGCVNPDHLVLGDRNTIHQIMKQNKRGKYYQDK
jgi:hypothetical protein